jgi:hypothetical protein
MIINLIHHASLFPFIGLITHNSRRFRKLFLFDYFSGKHSIKFYWALNFFMVSVDASESS